MRPRSQNCHESDVYRSRSRDRAMGLTCTHESSVTVPSRRAGTWANGVCGEAMRACVGATGNGGADNGKRTCIHGRRMRTAGQIAWERGMWERE